MQRLYGDGVRTRGFTTHSVGVIRGDCGRKLRRATSLQRERKLKRNPIPICLASVM